MNIPQNTVDQKIKSLHLSKFAMINSQFVKAIEATGMTAPSIIHADGALHRFSATGRKTDRAAWYVLHSDGVPAGVFGCWRTGLTETWCAKPQQQLSAQERTKLRQRVQQAKAQRDQEQAQRQQAAQQTALERWNAAWLAVFHPYCKAKGIKPYGLRTERDCTLLVPMEDASGVLHSLQTIAPDGR